MNNKLIKDNRINIILLVINTILLLYIIYFIVICHVGVVNYASYAYYTAFNIFNKVTSFLCLLSRINIKENYLFNFKYINSNASFFPCISML